MDTWVRQLWQLEEVLISTPPTCVVYKDGLISEYNNDSVTVDLSIIYQSRVRETGWHIDNAMRAEPIPVIGYKALVSHNSFIFPLIYGHRTKWCGFKLVCNEATDNVPLSTWALQGKV